MRSEPGARQSLLTLCVPLLQTLFADVKDFRSRRTQPGFVFLGLGVCGGDRGMCFFHSPGRQLASSSQDAHQRSMQHEAVGQNQNQENNNGRHRAEEEIAELTQKFIYHDFADLRGWKLLERVIEQLVVTEVKLQCQRAGHTLTAIPKPIVTGRSSAD